jgi:hypothetical protein
MQTVMDERVADWSSLVKAEPGGTRVAHEHDGAALHPGQLRQEATSARWVHQSRSIGSHHPSTTNFDATRLTSWRTRPSTTSFTAEAGTACAYWGAVWRALADKGQSGRCSYRHAGQPDHGTPNRAPACHEDLTQLRQGGCGRAY